MKPKINSLKKWWLEIKKLKNLYVGVEIDCVLTIIMANQNTYGRQGPGNNYLLIPIKIDNET